MSDPFDKQPTMPPHHPPVEREREHGQMVPCAGGEGIYWVTTSGYGGGGYAGPIARLGCEVSGGDPGACREVAEWSGL